MEQPLRDELNQKDPGHPTPSEKSAADDGRNGAPSPEPIPASQARKLTPEEMEWALQQFSEEECIAGLREVQQTGGLELRDFLHELEKAAGADE